MIKDEFHHLMNMFKEGAAGKAVNMHEVFKESLTFFEHLRKEFEQGTPEERKEILQMITSMQKEILEESKKIMKSSGMTEDQLINYAENPSNFSDEQWAEFQDSKEKIHKAGADLVKVVRKLLPANEHKDHSVQAIKESKKGKQVGKKTGWMRT